MSSAWIRTTSRPRSIGAPPPTANVTAWELYRRAGQPEVLRSDSAAREALGLAPEAERALEADPLSASARGELARALMVNGRCGEALDALEPLEDLQPTLLRAGLIAVQCHAQMGMFEASVADIRRGQPRSGDYGKASLTFS